MTSSPPLISVVTPTFNAVKTLERCIKSLERQTFRHFEYIVVDGLSTDGTTELISQFSNSIDKCIVEPDRGVYDAMNKGINLCRGKWIYFLGADDQLADEFVFEDVSRVLNNTTAKMVYGNVIMNGASKWAPSGALYDGVFDMKKLFKRNICHQAIFYSRSVFDSLGLFNADYKICADWDFNHRCFAKVENVFVDKTISFFSGGGVSSSNVVDLYSSHDCVSNLKSYYGIPYVSSVYAGYSVAFLNNFGTSLRKWRVVRAFFFLFLAFYHSRSRLSTFKRLLLRKW